MGVLPLRLPGDVRAEALGLGVQDRIEVDAARITPRGKVAVRIRRADGKVERIEAIAEVETALEAEVLRAGGILPMMLTGALSEVARG
jgi:aconitate hydratase